MKEKTKIKIFGTAMLAGFWASGFLIHLSIPGGITVGIVSFYGVFLAFNLLYEAGCTETRIELFHSFYAYLRERCPGCGEITDENEQPTDTDNDGDKQQQ